MPTNSGSNVKISAILYPLVRSSIVTGSTPVQKQLRMLPSPIPLLMTLKKVRRKLSPVVTRSYNGSLNVVSNWFVKLSYSSMRMYSGGNFSLATFASMSFSISVAFPSLPKRKCLK